MFTPGGQIDHLTFGGLRGGGKGGSSSSDSLSVTPTVLTDPVSGKSFVSYSTGNPTYDAMLGYSSSGQTAQDQLNAEITSREASEKATSDASTAATAAKAASDEQTFQNRLNTAQSTGRTTVENYFRNQGLDPSKYSSYIDPALSSAYQSVSDLDPNPSAAFPSTLGQTIVNDITSGSRTRAGNQLASLFPTTYANTSLQYNNIDPYVSQILDEQFNPLSTQLDAAHKRGTLRDTGYNAALAALGSSKTAAESQVRTLGQGIIDKDRQAVGDYVSGAKTDVGNMSQGQLETFDPSVYQSGATDLTSRELGSLGGDIRSAVGNTKFADLQTLLNAGGSVQGAGDPSAINVSGANGDALLTPNTAQDQNTKRGLGTAGAF